MNRRAFLGTLLAVPLALKVKPEKLNIEWLGRGKLLLWGGSPGGGKTEMMYRWQMNMLVQNPSQCAIISNIGQ